MKNAFLLALPLLFFVASCDKIKDPIEKKNTVVGSNYIVKDNKDKSHFKKVLLEDYTGHTCGNCPKASEIADTLSARYKDSLVVMAVHAGNYAELKPGYQLDLRTMQVGELWFQDPPTGFGYKTAGNPNGMINRKIYPASNLIQAYTKWKSTVPYSLANDPFVVRLNVTTEYDPDVRALNTIVDARFMQTFAHEVKISAMLLEDSIIGDQTDYRKFPDHIPDFKFEHVLRASLNSNAWGNSLKTGPIASNDSIRSTFMGFAVDPNFNDKRLSVVVYVYDATNLEVIQVEKVKIR